MRLICPQCGLKGTAAANLILKKIKCPECRHVFRLTQEVMVAPVNPSGAGPTQPDSGESIAGKLGTCAVCGFTLSQTYLTRREGKIFCTICAPA